MAGLQNQPLNRPQAKRCKRRAWKIRGSKVRRLVDKDKISGRKNAPEFSPQSTAVPPKSPGTTSACEKRVPRLQ